jgi:hypothetical protein
LKWVSPRYSTHPSGDSVTNSDNPTIADFDGDGRPELVVGANVFNAGGSLRWAGTAGQGYQSDAFESGAISLLADLDLDGSPEVVTGNTGYRADGTILCQVPLADGYPEIAVVSRGSLRLHEADGALLDLDGFGWAGSDGSSTLEPRVHTKNSICLMDSICVASARPDGLQLADLLAALLRSPGPRR